MHLTEAVRKRVVAANLDPIARQLFQEAGVEVVLVIWSERNRVAPSEAVSS
jgi:predicted RecB family endonuclease